MYRNSAYLDAQGHRTSAVHGWVILGQQTVVQAIKNFSAFMESKGALQFSQKPTTGPYPKPDEYNP
jgi:hypothetical protein